MSESESKAGCLLRPNRVESARPVVKEQLTVAEQKQVKGDLQW